MQFHNYSAVSATRERASGAGAQHLLLSLKYPAALYLGSASWKVFGSPKFLMMIPKHLTPSVFLFFDFLFFKRQADNQAALLCLRDGERGTDHSF